MPVSEVCAGELQTGDTVTDLQRNLTVVAVDTAREYVRLTLAEKTYTGERRQSVSLPWSTRVMRRVPGHVVMIGAAL